MLILSLDGGGLRGILTARLLERIQEKKPGFLIGTDMLAGTSTGGILALALALGEPPGRIISLYREHGPKIFKKKWWRRFLSVGVIWAEYRSSRLRNALYGVLKDATLGDLPRPVLVPAFDLDAPRPDGGRGWKPKFFDSSDEADHDVPLLDVAMATSAAPTYFPTHGSYVDGGVVANNPSACALAAALSQGTPLGEVRLLSLGTGAVRTSIPGGDHDWGLKQWARPLMNILVDGVSDVADFQCRQVLGDRYLRLNPTLPEEVPMDRPDKIDDLVRWADEADIGPVVDWL
jgi:patatin-like phospholipase/acyl hydrolase